MHSGARLRGWQVEHPSPRRHLRSHGRPAVAATAAAFAAFADNLLLLLLPRASRAGSGGGFSGRVALDRARERGARGGGGVLGGVNAQPREQLAEGGRRLALGWRGRRRHRRRRLPQQACRRFREAGIKHQRLLVAQRAQAVRQRHRLGAAPQLQPRGTLVARQRRRAHGDGEAVGRAAIDEKATPRRLLAPVGRVLEIGRRHKRAVPPLQPLEPAVAIGLPYRAARQRQQAQGPAAVAAAAACERVCEQLRPLGQQQVARRRDSRLGVGPGREEAREERGQRELPPPARRLPPQRVDQRRGLTQRGRLVAREAAAAAAAAAAVGGEPGEARMDAGVQHGRALAPRAPQQRRLESLR